MNNNPLVIKLLSRIANLELENSRLEVANDTLKSKLQKTENHNKKAHQ